VTDSALLVEGLSVAIGDLEIVKGLDLDVPFGELHAIMGPNGSGKSTLCHALTGKPGYTVSGSASVAGSSILDLEVDERAHAGLLQAFQYPVQVPGLELSLFVEEALRAAGSSEADARRTIAAASEQFEMDRFLEKSVNDGLSGGEKKRSEIFQLAALQPKVALLDEIDSGLDIDAVKEVAAAVQDMRGEGVAVVMITHYSRILGHVPPDRVHVMMAGRIVDSGGPELADELEAGGYGAVRARLGIETPVAPSSEKAPSEFFTDTPFDL
jgi:Fe-S cluster assembly ATP-binding protein